MNNYEARFDSVLSSNRVRLIIDLGFDVSVAAAVQVYGVNALSPASNDVAEREQCKRAEKFIVAAIASKPLRIRTRKRNPEGVYVTEVLYNDASGQETSLGAQMLLAGLSKVIE